jgi:hypothetical protein
MRVRPAGDDSRPVLIWVAAVGAATLAGACRSSDDLPATPQPSARAVVSAAPSSSAAVAVEVKRPVWSTPPRRHPQSPLFVVAEGKCTTFHPASLGQAILVAHGSGWAPGGGIVEPDGFIARGEHGGRLRDEPKLLSGLWHDQHGHLRGHPSLMGRWPDALWLEVGTDHSATLGSDRFHWTGGKWEQLVASAEEDTQQAFQKFAGSFQLWSDNRMLVRCPDCLKLRTFLAFDARTGRVRPALTKDAPPIPSSYPGPAFIRAFESGEVLMWQVSEFREEAGGAGQLSKWDPKQKRWHTFRVANLLDSHHFVAHRPSRAWALAKRPSDEKDRPKFVVVHFDGKAVHVQDTPFVTDENSRYVDSMDVSADGTLWIVHRHELWKRPPQGAWQKVVLPPPVLIRATPPPKLKAKEVTASGNNEVWVSTTYFDRRPEARQWRKRGALLRNQQPAEVQHCDQRAEGGEIFSSWPPPADERCLTPFAVLSYLRPTAKPDADVPKLWRALFKRTEFSAVRFVEIEDGGRRYIGGIPPDHKTGRTLVELVARRVPGATPELVCATPEKIRRTLTVDLKNGRLGRGP